MKKRRYSAILLSVCLVTGMFGTCSRYTMSAETDSTLKDQSFHRVITGNNNGLLRYTYEDMEGNVVEPQPVERVSVSRRNPLRQKLLQQQENLPESYDPRGTEKETPIRDQTDTGSCWAFGTMKSLEGNAIAQGLYSPEEADFSENHLVWYTYHNLTDTTSPLYGDYLSMTNTFGRPRPDEYAYDMGGNALFSTFILANGWGAVMEEEAPFLTAAEMAAEMRLQPESFRWQSEMQMTDADCYDYATQEEIKQEILENGAMSVSLYYPSSSRDKQKYLYETDEFSSLYQNDKAPEDANHCVTIVGWDDQFDSFNLTPKEKGAWLIANSYGTDSNDNGYFWVSYEDTALCEFYSFHGVAAADAYDTAYQYDGFGWGNGFKSDEDIAAANVFTNQEENAQSISAVSFYTFVDGQDYEINIYRRVGENGPTDGEWVGRCTTSGTQKYSGYHTVQLTEPIAVDAGEKFSVIVTFAANTGKSYVLFEDEDYYEYYYYGRKGESYLFLTEDNTWYDAVEESLNNMCVKAFADTITAEEYQAQEENYLPSEGGTFPWSNAVYPAATPSASPGKKTQSTVATKVPASSKDAVKSISGRSKVIMGKGEKLILPVKTLPGSGKSTLKYRSSNTSVVTVSNKGKIHAKKTGSAKITITASSGVKKQMKIRVKKAPKSVHLTAAKTRLKQGKSVELKVSLSKNSASYALKFVSRNKKVASVSGTGKVKAKKAGMAKIQVKTFNNKKGSIKIKVVP